MNKKLTLKGLEKKLVVKPTTFGNNLVVDKILTTTLKLCVTVSRSIRMRIPPEIKKVVLVVVLVVGSKGL